LFRIPSIISIGANVGKCDGLSVAGISVGLLLIGLCDGFAMLDMAISGMDGFGVGSRVTGDFVG
jgi:hypothetical protein